MNKKLHIIFLDFDDIKNPLLAAGQAKATLEVGKEMVKFGHKVEIISSRYPGYKDRKENGMIYRHIGLNTNNIRINNFIYILAVPFAIRKLKGDVIVECFTAPISTLFSPLFTKIPVVALTSSFEAERFSQLYHFPFYVVERYGLKFYRYGIALTEFFSEKMKKGNKNIITRVIPEGVGPEFFTIKRKKAKQILFLGRLDMSQKGIDLLLQAYKLVANKIAYPLVIAGNGPDEEKVKKMITKLGLEKKVTMIGATYGQKKAAILSESLLVAFTSRNETFSCFGLEALASGLPLVAFDIPGLSWTKDTVVFKAPAFNFKKYAQLLLTKSEEISQKSISNETRKFAKLFTWEKVATDFISFFYEVKKIEKTRKENN
jgi:glycosyltransferase involved in cell wall biosynthesis